MRKVLVLLILLLLLASAYAAAQELEFALPRWSIDGGAGSSAGGGYALSATLGQPDAGPALSGGDYTLTGGIAFRPQQDVTQKQKVYLPLLTK
jgi:hypothetical protein